MRKINTRHFRLATRQTQRDVNQRIALNLIREYGPISRAELSRKMQVRRGSMTALVRALAARGLVEERGAAAVVRGRRPSMLTVRASARRIAAADVRPLVTNLALTDASGQIIVRSSIKTPSSPETLAQLVADGLNALAASTGYGTSVAETCVGAGIVVPGMIDRRSGRLLYSPRLGWRDVDLRNDVAERLGVKTYIESAPIACALARLWLAPDQTRGVNSFAYVHVSDGIGVGLVLNGEAIRGETNSAGEFGHIALEPGGPVCVCGKRGCWEALASNSATVARYLGAVRGNLLSDIDIREVVRRAMVGDAAAAAALSETAEYIGRGLAMLVAAFNPGRVFLGGEITPAWELIEAPIRAALVAAGISDAARATPVIPDAKPGEQRLRGAAALVDAPAFAALTVG